jgi:hypothetical protein
MTSLSRDAAPQQGSVAPEEVRGTGTAVPRKGLTAPLIIATLAAAYVVLRGTSDPTVSDFDQLWHGARALMRGVNPYSVVGPNREFQWDSLYYPLPAMLVVSPLAFLPLLAARACFAAISAGLLAAALRREGSVRLLVFLSAPLLIAIGRGQWSPLILAAAYLPWLAWIGVAKPHIALAVLPLSQQPRAALMAAALGGGALLIVSFIVEPGWVGAWRAAVGIKGDTAPVLLRAGGFGILLALLRWRRRDARMLVALGSMPQTPSFYDAVPLFAIPRGFRETAGLVIAGNVALLLLVSGIGLRLDEMWVRFNERVELWSLVCLYLPCTWIVLRRPNANQYTPAAPAKGVVDLALLAALLMSAFFATWATLARFM